MSAPKAKKEKKAKPEKKSDGISLALKLRAWWNGVPVSNLTVVENSGDTNAPNQDSLKVQIANIMWGEGRINPFDEKFDQSLLENFELQKGQSVHILGGETGARIQYLLNAAPIKVSNHEKNSVINEFCNKIINSNKKLAKSFSGKLFDGKLASIARNKADIAIILFQSENLAALESNCFLISRILKPKGHAILVEYCINQPDLILSNCKKNDQEFIQEEEFGKIFKAAGLKLEFEEDWGAPFLNSFHKMQTKLLENWENIQAQLIKLGGATAASTALEEIMIWRARHDNVKNTKLIIKKYILSKA